MKTTTLSFRRFGPQAFLRVEAAAVECEVFVNGHRAGGHLGAWTPFHVDLSPWLEEENTVEVRCEWRDHCTNGFLPTLGVRWVGARGLSILPRPLEPEAAAPSRARVQGTRLLVDGAPFTVRGMLHWGYYPELEGPWPSPQQARWEIEYLKSLGFNLIKFCLWIPPAHYYQLCEELGMFVWQEYPVWNAPLDDPGIVAEYEEFFRNDGPYSCVILRSLTCENDRVDPEVAQLLMATARRMLPGCVIIDNSSWLCSERLGDFHDEHIYLNPMQFQYYPQRVGSKLRKPLLLGESMCVDTPPEGPHTAGVEVRRFQIETLASGLPDAGYVVTALRDTPTFRGGFLSEGGEPKFSPREWAWHGRSGGLHRTIPPLRGSVIGPRKGAWKCPEVQWWSPVVVCHDERLPQALIQEEAPFQLLSGRVLAQCEGTNVLVEMLDYHAGTPVRHPLVIAYSSGGIRHVVSAFRHDTPVGEELWRLLRATPWEAPEIGPLWGDAIVLEEWEMSVDGVNWIPVRCDTPLVNGGKNVLEGHATFRTRFSFPGGSWVLRAESVADWYEITIDGRVVGEAGNRWGTWDGARYVPKSFPVDLAPGLHEIIVRVRDWTAAGCLVGPVYFTQDLSLRVF